jgi:hypothetical protein
MANINQLLDALITIVWNFCASLYLELVLGLLILKHDFVFLLPLQE